MTTEHRHLLSLLPDMKQAVIDAACEHRRLETRCDEKRPYDPVWAQTYKAKVMLMRAVDNLLDAQAEIERLRTTSP